MSESHSVSDPPNLRQKFRAFAKFLIKSFLLLATLAVVGLAILFAILWTEHKTEITLPTPTGQFPVGRISYLWVNNAQTDELASSPNSKREVVVWIWYPSEDSAST